MTFLNERDLTYAIGTVSITNGATTVEGASTLWGGVVRQWDWISIDGSDPVPITSMTDASSLEIPAWQGASKAAVSYVVYQLSPLRYSGAQQSVDIDNMLTSLNTDGWYRFVKPSVASPTAQGIVANDGQFALQYTTGKLWVMDGGVWVFVGTYKGFQYKGAYDDATSYATYDVLTYDGTAYIVTTPTTGNVPPNATYYDVFVSKGDVGETGDPGHDSTIAIGTVTSVAYGQPATVTNEGTAGAAVFNFEIPKGQDGTGTGDVQGPSGATDAGVVGFDGTTGKLVKGLTASEVRSAAGATTIGEALLTAADEDAAQNAAGATTIGKSLLTASDAADARDTLGGTAIGEALFTAADATAALAALAMPNYLTGLTLSTAGGSSTFGIAAGFATDSSNASMMALSSAYSKTTSAWAVGSANGALDTGTIAANTWYHVFLIKRTDTGVVDVLISTSATSPTLPTNYTLFRRIGTMKTDGSSQWTKFVQVGDEFLWDVAVLNVSTSPGTTAIQTLTVTTPPGVKTIALFNVGGVGNSDNRGRIFSPDVNSAGALANTTSTINFGGSGTIQVWSTARVRTNTSAQIKYAMTLSTGIPAITTAGWVDDRGKVQ
ncbi:MULTISPECIES: hypothetical protein [unclassified Nitrobacter]|uniref:hypothetical protein n=1 Tax=unclassified Nitrobacter TaxID=2620411 RepID=UPI000A44D6BD|nr:MULTISPECIES: hypothetical protein [unclassified Nitrobacter]MBN9147185.1 hypothetical protein [Nitrobacter sp.]